MDALTAQVTEGGAVIRRVGSRQHTVRITSPHAPRRPHAHVAGMGDAALFRDAHRDSFSRKKGKGIRPGWYPS
jgi:hypothetical protein